MATTPQSPSQPRPKNPRIDNPRITRTARDYYLWLRRWFWILPITTITGYLLGQYVASATPPVYQSQAVVEIKRMKQEATGVDEEERFRLSAMGELMSTIEKLKFPNLQRAVANGSEIARLRREEGITNFLPERRELLPWKREKKAQRASAETTPETLAAIMPGWLSAKWRDGTNLIDLRVEHTEPKIAQAVAIGLLIEYERLKEDSVTGSSRDTLKFILREAQEVKDRILAKENAVQLYNRCTTLKNSVRQAEDEIVALEKKYLPKWPPLIEAHQLLELLRERFVAELNLVKQSADVEEKKYWQLNEEKTSELDDNERIDHMLRLVESRAVVLRSEIGSEQQLYSSLMDKWHTGNVSERVVAKEFSVEDPPTLPSWPFKPNRSAIIKDFTIKGSLAGVAVIFLLGFLDRTLRTVEDIEALTQYEVVGAFPAIRGLAARTAKAATKYPGISDDDPMTAETMRTLRAGLSFLGDKKERQTFLITSAMPAEGKSWISSNLAAAFALQGDRTLIVDFDLRKPVQHTIFGLDPDHPGVTDYLAMEVAFEDIIQAPKGPEGLWVITAGSWTANPGELLTSRNVARFVGDAAQIFDRVIIDTPPILSVRDALPLAKLVQSNILVFRTGKTHARALMRALRILEDNQTPPVGIAANYLKGKSPDTYGYYYSYGNKSYESYYAEDEKKKRKRRA